MCGPISDDIGDVVETADPKVKKTVKKATNAVKAKLVKAKLVKGRKSSK